MWNGIDPPFKGKGKPEAEPDANAGAKPKRYEYHCPECGHKWDSRQSPRDGVTIKICFKCERKAIKHAPLPSKNPQSHKRDPAQPKPRSNKENRNPGNSGRQKPLELPGGADNRDKPKSGDRPGRAVQQPKPKSTKNSEKDSRSPQKSNSDSSEKKTPYQGPKRCFGEYHCLPCNKRWKSGNSWANMGQQCKKCGSNVFPHRQKTLEPPSIADFRCPRCKKTWTNDRCWKEEPEPCPRCKKTWTGDRCWKEEPEPCPRCKTKVYPHNLLPYADPELGSRTDKPHPQQLCQKCRQLGFYCGTRDSDRPPPPGYRR